MSTNFNLYSKYYNLLYEGKDYQSEAGYVAGCIKTYSPTAEKIIEFGSGTGSHGLLLQKMGFEIYGIERSDSMVQEARRKGFPCEQGDITNFNTRRRSDVVISLFHVISYITDNKSLIKVFQNAADCLNPKGMFLFDVWYTPAVCHQKAEARIKKAEDRDIEVLRIARPSVHENTNIVEVNYHILVRNKQTDSWTEFEEVHPMRHFSIPEIELLAYISGFSVISSEEFLTGDEPSHKSWGVMFILRKNE